MLVLFLLLLRPEFKNPTEIKEGHAVSSQLKGHEGQKQAGGCKQTQEPAERSGSEHLTGPVNYNSFTHLTHVCQ